MSRLPLEADDSCQGFTSKVEAFVIELPALIAVALFVAGAMALVGGFAS